MSSTQAETKDLLLEITDLSVSYGAIQALKSVSLEVPREASWQSWEQTAGEKPRC
jgi:ABC-type uncharacterized transport system ATPase subunit